MDKIKFILFSIVVLALVALVGYWGVTALQSGSEHKQSQKIKSLEEENENLKTELEVVKEELAEFESKYGEPEVVASADSVSEVVTENKPTTTATAYKHQGLINELQELIDDNVHMKLKSKGSRVGTVQNFLNIYNKTSNRVDNDYGASTKTVVANFQKSQGLTADGEAGPSTFTKMIEWLKKQG